ncbi:LAQU0S01e12464g1_1 [Lachancea quebecensis]|uniref:LAQU0S01e12464g1_1 n=1 Tax=Lachancea quebecensis TaxID=1654605 RepID=A0A0P1KLM1_9SACH|nr:LAQU0S01e12464g1_1 [Lachancea quebecensis]
MHSESNTSPQQRIITSEQWVFDRRGSREESKAGGRPKRTPISKQERELRRKQRELENKQLQQEHQTVANENARLKAVVARLKQDIDAYTRLVLEATAQGSPAPASQAPASQTPTQAQYEAQEQGASSRQALPQLLDELPPMETLLVNTAKRRKHTAAGAGAGMGAEAGFGAQDPPVLKNTHADVMLAPQSAEVGPEEVALMRKLKDVLAEME